MPSIAQTGAVSSVDPFGNAVADDRRSGVQALSIPALLSSLLGAVRSETLPFPFGWHLAPTRGRMTDLAPSGLDRAVAPDTGPPPS